MVGVFTCRFLLSLSDDIELVIMTDHARLDPLTRFALQNIPFGDLREATSRLTGDNLP